MSIIKTHALITHIQDLSKTAKEIVLTPQDPLTFIAGSFVNVFMNIDGEKVRRAYSISSSDTDSKTITLSIRLSPSGKMTPLFWNKNLIEEKIEIMGPLGLNTADKMTHSNIYLFGFGIGAGVVKSLAEHFSKKDSLENLTIITGSRTSDEIIYKDYFDTLEKTSPKIHVSYVVSTKEENNPYNIGYIQDYFDGFNFNKSDVYVCGQEVACNALIQKVKDTDPIDCTFLIEAFH